MNSFFKTPTGRYGTKKQLKAAEDVFIFFKNYKEKRDKKSHVKLILRLADFFVFYQQFLYGEYYPVLYSGHNIIRIDETLFSMYSK